MLAIFFMVIWFANLFAFLDGINAALGFGTILGLIAAVVLGVVPLGGVVAAWLSFYGAYYVWDWPLAGAIFLAAPYLVITIVFALGGGLFSSLRKG